MKRKLMFLTNADDTVIYLNLKDITKLNIKISIKYKRK